MSAPKPKTKKPRKYDIQKLRTFELDCLVRDVVHASVGCGRYCGFFDGVDLAAIQATRGPQARMNALTAAIRDAIERDQARQAAQWLRSGFPSAASPAKLRVITGGRP